MAFLLVSSGKSTSTNSSHSRCSFLVLCYGHWVNRNTSGDDDSNKQKSFAIVAQVFKFNIVSSMAIESPGHKAFFSCYPLTEISKAQLSPGSNLGNTLLEDSRFAHFAGLFTAYAVNFAGSHVRATSHLGPNPWILDSGSTNSHDPHKHLLQYLPLPKSYLALPNGYKVKVGFYFSEMI
ncbi:hypothetical protein HAX54_038986 [Datura stramonium]|uniref:Uncharacterized protein n=1 Tax=Datura stramonium TaxID=4076 RepID=A0ABS8SIN1_DATST|nr:hypothetical protein [Datura stramonium]